MLGILSKVFLMFFRVVVKTVCPSAVPFGSSGAVQDLRQLLLRRGMAVLNVSRIQWHDASVVLMQRCHFTLTLYPIEDCAQRPIDSFCKH